MASTAHEMTTLVHDIICLQLSTRDYFPLLFEPFLIVLQSPNNFPQNCLLDHPQWAGVKMNQETSVSALETQLSLDAHYLAEYEILECLKVILQYMCSGYVFGV